MQSTSALYKTLLADPGHRKEVRVLAGEAVLGEETLVAVSTSGSLFETPGIGNCVSRQIRLQCRAGAVITQGMALAPAVRLVKGLQVSEWIPRGVFFADTVEADPVSGVVAIHGYDAMMRAEAVWLDSTYDEVSWPMSERAAVEDIARRMGVEIDERTVLSDTAMVDYPVDENGDLTMRQVLSYIAVSGAGNWIISDAGKLRLVPYRSAPPETYNLITESGDAITFGGVKIHVG